MKQVEIEVLGRQMTEDRGATTVIFCPQSPAALFCLRLGLCLELGLNMTKD
jgi:hypothetical protein